MFVIEHYSPLSRQVRLYGPFMTELAAREHGCRCWANPHAWIVRKLHHPNEMEVSSPPPPPRRGA